MGGRLMNNSWARRFGPYPPVIAIQLVLWQLLAGQIAHGNVIAPPVAVLQAVWSTRDSLAPSCLATLQEAGLGFLIGVGLGIILALVAVLAAPVERTVLGVSVVLASVPIVALAPVLALALGPGLSSKVVVAALACFFTSLITVLLGLRRPTEGQLAVFRVYDARELDVLLRLRLPAALPSLVVACKLAVPAAILGAILGEWSGADSGLGVLMLSEQRNYQVEGLWATILVTTVVSALGYGLFALLERPVTRRLS